MQMWWSPSVRGNPSLFLASSKKSGPRGNFARVFDLTIKIVDR
jgi:hypothetical protein